MNLNTIDLIIDVISELVKQAAETEVTCPAGRGPPPPPVSSWWDPTSGWARRLGVATLESSDWARICTIMNT